MTMWHAIQHWFGWNTGRVESHWDGNVLMMGFRCDGCGQLQHVHATGMRKDNMRRNSIYP